jgi:hypothetical protein
MVFTSRSILVGSTLLLSLLSGCAMNPCCGYSTQDLSVRPDVAANCVSAVNGCGTPARASAASPTKFSAVGRGSMSSYPQYTVGQQKMMAMRAAQVDAYRNLAEQVQGFRLTGGTTVSAFALQSDTVRTYVDAFIRGARLAGVNAIGDGNYEATVELELSNRFFDCVLLLGNCGVPQMAMGCAAAGCIAPSASYFSY